MDPELKRIIENVQKLVAQGAPQEHIEGYARSEGYSLDDLNQAADPGRVSIERPGAGRGMLASALRGAVPFSDEIGAGVKAAGTLLPGRRPASEFGEAYSENVEAAREGREAFAEDRPGLSLTAMLGGAVAGPGAAVAKVAGRAAKGGLGLLRLAGLGAAEGAVFGAGEADGGLGDRLEGAAVGGGVGAATGAILPALGRGARAAGTKALDVTGLRPTGPGSGTLGRAAQRLGVSSVDDRAQQRIAAALPEGDDLAAARTMIAESDRPLSVIDVDENVAGIARAARSVGGDAKRELPEFLGRRVADQETRILDDALQLSGVQRRTNIFETLDEIVARRSADAEQNYGPIRDIVVNDPRLLDYMNRDSFRRAYNVARRIGSDRGEPLPDLDMLVASNAPMPLGFFDRIKRGLDDILAKAPRDPLDAGGLGPEGMGTLRNAKNEFVALLDQAVPEYAGARSAFAGESAMLDMLQQGRNLFRMHPQEAARILQNAGDSEREMFVRGGLEALAEQVERTASSFDLTARRPLRDATRDRQLLRLLFPDDQSFQQFQRGIADEALMAHRNRFVTGNSQTADKLMEIASMVGVDVAQLATGNVTGALAGLARGALANRAKGYSTSLSDALMPYLTATGEAATDVIDDVARRRAQGAGQRSLVDLLGLGSAASAGGAAGRATRDRDGRLR